MLAVIHGNIKRLRQAVSDPTCGGLQTFVHLGRGRGGTLNGYRSYLYGLRLKLWPSGKSVPSSHLVLFRGSLSETNGTRYLCGAVSVARCFPLRKYHPDESRCLYHLLAKSHTVIKLQRDDDATIASLHHALQFSHRNLFSVLLLRRP